MVRIRRSARTEEDVMGTSLENPDEDMGDSPLSDPESDDSSPDDPSFVPDTEKHTHRIETRTTSGGRRLQLTRHTTEMVPLSPNIRPEGMELSSCGQEMIPCGESDEECGGSNPSDDDGEGKASNSRKKNLKSEKDKQRKPSGRYKKKSHIRGETPDPNDRRTHPAPTTYKNTLPIAFVHFQEPPYDPSLDIATPIGRISQNNFNRLVHAFIMDLCPQKRYKAIIAKDLYDEIVRTLTDVGGSDARAEGVQKATPQFRFWCKKQFELTDDGRLKHENRLVAKKEDFYEIVTSSHEAADHGGRDKTMAMIRKTWSYIPKDIVARFAGECPGCPAVRGKKKRKGADTGLEREVTRLADGYKAEVMEARRRIAEADEKNPLSDTFTGDDIDMKEVKPSTHTMDGHTASSALAIKGKGGARAPKSAVKTSRTRNIKDDSKPNPLIQRSLTAPDPTKTRQHPAPYPQRSRTQLGVIESNDNRSTEMGQSASLLQGQMSSYTFPRVEPNPWAQETQSEGPLPFHLRDAPLNGLPLSFEVHHPTEAASSTTVNGFGSGSLQQDMLSPLFASNMLGSTLDRRDSQWSMTSSATTATGELILTPRVSPAEILSHHQGSGWPSFEMPDMDMSDHSANAFSGGAFAPQLSWASNAPAPYAFNQIAASLATNTSYTDGSKPPHPSMSIDPPPQLDWRQMNWNLQDSFPGLANIDTSLPSGNVGITASSSMDTSGQNSGMNEMQWEHFIDPELMDVTVERAVQEAGPSPAWQGETPLVMPVPRRFSLSSKPLQDMTSIGQSGSNRGEDLNSSRIDQDSQQLEGEALRGLFSPTFGTFGALADGSGQAPPAETENLWGTPDIPAETSTQARVRDFERHAIFHLYQNTAFENPQSWNQTSHRVADVSTNSSSSHSFGFAGWTENNQDHPRLTLPIPTAHLSNGPHRIRIGTPTDRAKAAAHELLQKKIPFTLRLAPIQKTAPSSPLLDEETGEMIMMSRESAAKRQVSAGKRQPSFTYLLNQDEIEIDGGMDTTKDKKTSTKSMDTESAANANAAPSFPQAADDIPSFHDSTTGCRGDHSAGLIGIQFDLENKSTESAAKAKAAPLFDGTSNLVNNAMDRSLIGFGREAAAGLEDESA